MPEEPLPPDDSTDPFEERPGGGTEYDPSSRPPEWTNDPDAVEPLPPPAFDRYQAHTFHKLGGMGRVWRARDAELGRDVAFKEIRPKYADDATARARFTFEAEVTGRLDHPAVIPVYGFGRDASGKPFYAMRFVEGQSLQEAVAAFYASSGPSGAERALKLRRLLAHFVTVCRAVDYAHSKGVIHRDLKPLNIMIGRFGETLVVDWGIAKRLRAGAGEAETAPDAPRPPVARGATAVGKGFGSPSFWSPEQAEGRPYDHDERTDVYGLGAVLFAVLTGHSPHPDGEHPPAVPGARDRCPWVDAGIDAVARRAMAYDPTGRYPSAAALADAVEEWLADQPLLAQRAAVQSLEQAAAEHPTDLALAEQLARQRSNLGLMLSGVGRDADAVACFRAAAAEFGNLAAARNKARLYAEQANGLLAMARSLAALGRADDAEQAQKAAAALYGRLIATRPDEYKANYATLMLPPGAVPNLGEPPEPPAPLPPTVPPDAGTVVHDAAPDGEQQLRLSGGYTVLGMLACDGTGALYLARDNALGRRVAIKALHESAAHEPHARARLLNEMRLTAALEHPNVVRVYTHGTRSDGAPFLVLEHLNGVRLLRLLEIHAPGWSSELLDPLAQACDGLHYAHTRGVVHRDAKLSSILVLKDGRAVVLDWGIAKKLGEVDAAAASAEAEDGGLSDPMLTQAGAVVGTPAYMSPEQARGDFADVGRLSDVYTLGADLFHLVAGRPPVTGDNGFDAIRQLVAGDIPRLRDVRPDAPPQLDDICARAMAVRPEDRYPTAAALAADIRAFLDEQKGT